MADTVLGPDGTTDEALEQLATEQVRAGLEDLDIRPTGDVVDLLLDTEARVPRIVTEARATLVAAVDLVTDALHSRGRLVYVGAGTAGRIAALDAVECRPTFGVSEDRVIALLAGGPDASDEAFEAAEDDGAAARADLEALAITGEDVVVGVTASGRTPYVTEALRYAREAGATTIAITNNRASVVSTLADHTVELLTGPEVVAGSTRLSAATAQKVALNVISTAAMVRCGRTYGAWMVGVQPTNAKLDVRARRILQQATGLPAATVLAALDEAEAPDVALVMLLGEVDASEARRRLDTHHGHVRHAVLDTAPA
jgi:N-acetylmuramic acid 6-phosphate etherase